MIDKPTDPSVRYLDYTVAFCALSVGGSGLVATCLFLLLGPLFHIDLGLSHPAKQFLNASLCLVFFAQHSGMVRPSVRKRFSVLRSARYYAAVYAIASGLILWLLIGLWQPTGSLVFAFEGPARLLVRSLFVVSIIGFIWGNKALGNIDGLGVEAVLKPKAPQAVPRRPQLSIKGPYRFVRHPLYLCMIMMIWSYPDWTTDRLLLNILWSTWIVIGARWEERDLIAMYGKPYEDYQRRVPMLLPFTKFN